MLIVLLVPEVAWAALTTNGRAFILLRLLGSRSLVLGRQYRRALTLIGNMVHNMVMIRLNIAEAETQLSRHIERVEQGETILLCRRNVPIAEIRPLSPRRSDPRPVGIDRGMEVPASFFEPVPTELLDGFYGEGET